MRKLNFKYLGLIFIVVIVSCLIHEFGHYLAGTLLGNHMGMTLNMTYPLNGELKAPWQSLYIESGGPVFSLLQAVVALLLIEWKGRSELLYLFVLEPVVLRIWPYLVSPLMAQDEAKVSQMLGLNPWVLPVIVWLILGVLAWYGSRKMHKKFREIAGAIVLMLIAFQIVLRINNLIVGVL